MQNARTRRTVIVILLALFSVALWAPDLRRLFDRPLGDYGFTVSLGSRVLALESGSPAAKADVRDGAFIDFTRMAPAERLRTWYSAWTLDPGDRVRITLVESGRRFDTSFVTGAEPEADLPGAAIRCVLALLLLCAGITVVLRKPSSATWAFFVFTLSGDAPVNVIMLLGPLWFQASMDLLFPILFVASRCAGVLFALFLLHDGALHGWRRFIAVTFPLLAAAAAALSILFVVGFLSNGDVRPMSYVAPLLVSIFFMASTPFVLLGTYLECGAATGERLRWVLAGFTITAIAQIVDIFGGNGSIPLFHMSYAAHSLLLTAGTISVCFTVVYAILKHRIIDVSVAISRAVVYGTLSALIVGTFALIDLFFNKTLERSHAGYIPDIALALILGFFFNTIHRHVDDVVDRLLFRTRHLADKHLTTVAAAIPYAESAALIDRLLTDEPIRAYDLAGARLFLRESMTDVAGDSLVAYLQGERRILRLSEHGWQPSAPIGFQPAVAAPVFSHGQLAAVVFYGFHKNGTELDSEEIEMLERLAASAGAGYDHLEAEALRHENEALRVQLTAMTSAQPSH